MKRLALLILAFLAAGGLLCGVSMLVCFNAYEPPHPPRDTVQGTVVDLDSGAPLPGVSLVCISGYPLSFFEHTDEVKTDAQGRFTLPIQYKDYHVEVRKRGYAPKTIDWLPPEERHSRMRIIRLAPARSKSS